MARAEQPSERAFTDVTEQAGIKHTHQKCVLDPKLDHIMPWMAAVGAAAAAVDYDRDGFVDLYVTNSKMGQPNFLYHNNGDFTFTEVAEKAGVARVNDEHGASMGAVFGDYDNDGHLDLYVIKWGCNRLFHNNADGSFTDVTEASGTGDCGNANGVIFLDYDNDGDLDIYIGNYFPYVDLWNLENVRIMHDDYEAAQNAGANVLYRNNGDGTFTNVAFELNIADSGWTLDVGCGDIDKDGTLEIFTANDFGRDRLYTYKGTDGFVDISEQAIGIDTRKGMNAEFGDYNNDGYLDIYVANITTDEFLKEGNVLYENLGDGTFVDVAVETGCWHGGWAWGCKFLDFDNDGDLDIYNVNGFVTAGEEDWWFDLAMFATDIAGDPADANTWPPMGNKSCSGNEPSRLFRNDGLDGFKEIAAEAGVDDRRDGRAIAVADFDNDGDLDMFVANQGTKPVLYRNDVGNKMNWFQIELTGTKSNRDAIGAWIELTTGDLIMVRQVVAGNGYASQSMHRAHFGLGHRDKIDKVEIRWPSGTVQIIENPDINQLLKVVEPADG
ncbi:MAG: CRTAC1 family protein [Candidatus Zixiibacteriota bacterium]